MISTFLLSGLMLCVPFNLSLVPPLHRDILRAPTHCRQKAKLLLGFLIYDQNFSFPPQLLFVARCWHFLSASSGCLQKNQVQCSSGVGVRGFIHPHIATARVLCDGETEEHLHRKPALKSCTVHALKSWHL